VPLVLAIDIGGTSARLGLVDPADGHIADRATLPTPARNDAGQPFLDAVTDAALKLCRGQPVEAAGLGICELVSVDGLIESGHRVPWQGLAVTERLGRIAPVTIESDVRAAALAEARLGAGRGHDPFLYLNIGTGLSAVLVEGGQPYRGAHGHALVIASGPTTSICLDCGKRHESVLEETAGGAGLAAAYARLKRSPWIAAPEIMARAATGDSVARKVITAATEALASTLGPLLGLTDPAALVIGGGLGAAPGPYFDALVPEIRRHIWSERTRAIPILRSALGGDAGLIGAALAASIDM
jgi:glucokinase